MGTCPADGVNMGHSRKRGKRATDGCAGRRERRTEGPLRDDQRGGDARPPWGRAGARGEKRRPAVLGKSRTLGSGGGNSGGLEASGVDPEIHGMGEEEGDREAS